MTRGHYGGVTADQEYNTYNIEHPDPDHPFDCTRCRGAGVHNPSLCEDCQDWNDVWHMFTCTRDDAIYDPFPSAKLSVLKKDRKECLICRTLVVAVDEKLRLRASGSRREAIVKDDPEVTDCGPWWLPPQSYVKCPRPMKGKVRLVHVIKQHRDQRDRDDNIWRIRCLMCVSLIEWKVLRLPAFGHRDDDWPDEALVCRVELQYNAAGNQLEGIQCLESLSLDLDLAAHCLKECKSSHPNCEDREDDLPSNFLVVDCETMCIRDLPAGEAFVALSYTWRSLSSANETQLTCATEAALRQSKGLHSRPLPPVIADAINLCLSLGRRYLWIGRLCIVQDNAERKSGQILAMDKVYGAAELTIVACAEGVGLPGIGGTLRRSSVVSLPRFAHATRIVMQGFDQAVAHSTWNSRGWTFQERLLSKRLLFIMDDAFYFTCQQARFHELSGPFKAYDGTTTNHGPNSVLAVDDMRAYLQCCEVYAARELKYDGDILGAFQDISNAIGRQLRSRMLYGVPEKYLVTSLLWTAEGKHQRRWACPDIPTWSWAAWKGSLPYGTTSTKGGYADRAAMNGTLARFYDPDESGNLCRSDVEESWFYQPLLIDPPSSITLAMPSHPIKPRYSAGTDRYHDWPATSETETVWSQCPQSPWTIMQQDLLLHGGLHVTDLPSHAILFRTTTAMLDVGPELTDKNISSFIPTPILYNASGEAVGDLMEGESAPRTATLGKHEFIVLCAGIDHPDNLLRRVSSFGRIRTYELQVMQIERDVVDPRLCRRVDIGCVLAAKWESCLPEWKNIVLV
ncbi:hypothetical protein LTR86_008185 [Recurvomyces mirabilis]|nr:hypothetical protein LTR86_008185 [Recurvomyces mirabilis]